jgi:hypothetical protein
MMANKSSHPNESIQKHLETMVLEGWDGFDVVLVAHGADVGACLEPCWAALARRGLARRDTMPTGNQTRLFLFLKFRFFNNFRNHETNRIASKSSHFEHLLCYKTNSVLQGRKTC